MLKKKVGGLQLRLSHHHQKFQSHYQVLVLHFLKRQQEKDALFSSPQETHQKCSFFFKAQMMCVCVSTLSNRTHTKKKIHLKFRGGGDEIIKEEEHV